MKSIRLFSYSTLILGLGLTFAACGSDPKGPALKPAAAATADKADVDISGLTPPNAALAQKLAQSSSLDDMTNIVKSLFSADGGKDELQYDGVRKVVDSIIASYTAKAKASKDQSLINIYNDRINNLNAAVNAQFN